MINFDSLVDSLVASANPEPPKAPEEPEKVEKSEIAENDPESKNTKNKQDEKIKALLGDILNEKIFYQDEYLGWVALERKETIQNRQKIQKLINLNLSDLTRSFDEKLAQKISEGLDDDKIETEKQNFEQKLEKLKETILETKLKNERLKTLKTHTIVPGYLKIKPGDYVIAKSKGRTKSLKVLSEVNKTTIKIADSKQREYEVPKESVSKVLKLKLTVYTDETGDKGVYQKVTKTDCNKEFWMFFKDLKIRDMAEFPHIGFHVFIGDFEVKLKDNFSSEEKSNFEAFEPKKWASGWLEGDKRKYYTDEEARQLILERNIKMAELEPLLENLEVEILPMTPEHLNAVQLYTRLLYEPARHIGCSIVVKGPKSMFLNGLAIIGPWPSFTGVSAFELGLEVTNMRSKENRRIWVKVENLETGTFKFFFDSPIFAQTGDLVEVRSLKDSAGMVYGLSCGNEGRFLGSDGEAEFRLLNFEENSIAAIYYTLVEGEDSG